MSTPITDADFTTYRRADGGDIGGEYAFVTQADWLDEEVGLDPVTFVEDRYTRIGSRTITIYPTLYLCVDCEGEGEDPMGARCARCEGTGDDPLAGQTVEGEPT